VEPLYTAQKKSDEKINESKKDPELAPLPSLARVTFFKKINEDQE
jgi:hypothetical protein